MLQERGGAAVTPELAAWVGKLGAGLAEAGHPLLGAAVVLAGEDGLLFTGRWSVAASTWFGDHAVYGSVLVPGAALVEIAAWAGAVAGCPRVHELMLETPLVLPEQGWVTVQVRVSSARPDGGRAQLRRRMHNKFNPLRTGQWRAYECVRRVQQVIGLQAAPCCSQ